MTQATQSHGTGNTPHAQPAASILIATDGREQSDGALIMGHLLAGDVSATRVVSVVKSLPVVSPEVSIAVSAEVEAARRADTKRTVYAQIERVWKTSAADVEVKEGDPAAALARVALESRAKMIVCGLGRHRVMDRMFGDETALRLVRVATAPVLAAASNAAAAPRQIVAGIDFSETSLRAARLAMEIASPGATVYLAHVAPRDSTLSEWAGSSYKQDAGDALEKARAQLVTPPGMIVQTVLLHGDPATELLAFAASVNADLIATGSQGHGFVARMLVGSVATRILRCSSCSVLTVPHAAAAARAYAAGDESLVTTLARPDWTTELDAFTRRNVGRRGVLEVEDPEIGAQSQEHDYPLCGVTYDPVDRRVEMMFGELGDVNHHLSRSIGDVTSIDVLTSVTGRDIALRIAHGVGQTLLTFTVPRSSRKTD